MAGIPACISLLPKQTYLNVNEDAAGTLERKRNYIYCLIVHILKQEKEMHIDNLVFKVRPWTHPIDACSVRRDPLGNRLLSWLFWFPTRSWNRVRNRKRLALQEEAVLAAPPVMYCHV